jgi:hypothetical protein
MKLKLIILTLAVAMLTALPVLAGDNFWSTHSFGNSTYESKATGVTLSGGQYRHIIYFKLNGPYRLRIHDITCNASGGSETYLDLNRIGEISTYHYDDDASASNWQWEVESI